MTSSASELFSVVVLISICARYLKGLNFGEEILHLRLHRGVGLFGACDFGCMLDSGECAFAFFNLEVRHHLIYDGVGVVEANFVKRSSGIFEIKLRFLEVVLEIFPSFLRQSGAFLRTGVVIENSLFVEDNEGEVDCLNLV